MNVPFLIKLTPINQIPQPRNRNLILIHLDPHTDPQRLREHARDAEVGVVRDRLVVEFVDDLFVRETFAREAFDGEREEGLDVEG